MEPVGRLRKPLSVALAVVALVVIAGLVHRSSTEVLEQESYG